MDIRRNIAKRRSDFDSQTYSKYKWEFMIHKLTVLALSLVLPYIDMYKNSANQSKMKSKPAYTSTKMEKNYQLCSFH